MFLKTTVVVTTAVDRQVEKVPSETLAQRWQEVNRDIKVPSVVVEVMEIEDEDGPSRELEGDDR